jgi:hypothetical protein
MAQIGPFSVKKKGSNEPLMEALNGIEFFTKTTSNISLTKGTKKIRN